jgi:hypothetical protein
MEEENFAPPRCRANGAQERGWGGREQGRTDAPARLTKKIAKNAEKYARKEIGMGSREPGF